jgi:hypothetical protein
MTREMTRETTREMTNEVTKYLLAICYHCEDAHRCDTEEECRACMADMAVDRHTEEKQQQEQTTEQLLREYAM